MPAQPFDYGVIQWVPCLDRGERLNVGVLIYSAVADHIACRVHLNPDRARSLFPHADIAAASRHLVALADVSRGEPSAGKVAKLSKGERFHWLVHPRSAALQVSAVHSGLSNDLQASLDRLFERLVELRRPPR